MVMDKHFVVLFCSKTSSVPCSTVQCCGNTDNSSNIFLIRLVPESYRGKQAPLLALGSYSLVRSSTRTARCNTF